MSNLAVGDRVLAAYRMDGWQGKDDDAPVNLTPIHGTVVSVGNGQVSVLADSALDKDGRRWAVMPDDGLLRVDSRG